MPFSHGRGVYFKTKVFSSRGRRLRFKTKVFFSPGRGVLKK
jgi:hypothetical protein